MSTKPHANIKMYWLLKKTENAECMSYSVVFHGLRALEADSPDTMKLMNVIAVDICLCASTQQSGDFPMLNVRPDGSLYVGS